MRPPRDDLKRCKSIPRPHPITQASLQFFRIHPAKNVTVDLRTAEAGVEFGAVQVGEPIPANHKLTAIATGEPVHQIWLTRGEASEPIASGAHVHSHNVRDNLWARIIEIVSGREFTHNETRGQREIASWKYGVTL